MTLCQGLFVPAAFCPLMAESSLIINPPHKYHDPKPPPLTWLMLGLPCFFFEVVSSPQREENLLLRLLADLDMACVLLLTPDSPVRAATCQHHTASGPELLQPQHTPHQTGGGKGKSYGNRGFFLTAGTVGMLPGAAFSLQINSLLPASNIEVDSTYHQHCFSAFNGRYFRGA